MVAPNWLQRHKGKREPFSWCWVKKETQQLFSRNHWGLERERKEIQKIDLQAIRGGNEIRTGAAALLCCFSFPCISTQAQTHTESFSEFQPPVIMLESGGETPLPSSLRRQMCGAWRLRKAQRFHTMEMGGYPRPILFQEEKHWSTLSPFASRLKLTVRFPCSQLLLL